MKFKKFFYITFSFFLLNNCTEEEPTFLTPETEQQPEPKLEPEIDEPTEPEKEVYFTFEVQENGDINNGLNYVIICSEEGRLLDYKPYENSSNLVFESSETSTMENIVVTLFKHYKKNGNTTTTVATYPEITKGTHWTLFSHKDENTKNEPIGEYDFTINNTPGLQTVSISNGHDFLRRAYIAYPLDVSHTFTRTPIYEKSKSFISVLDEDENWKYMFLENVDENDSFQFDYDEFKSFDSFITVDLPSEIQRLHYQVLGFDADQNYNHVGLEGYRLNHYSSFDPGIHQNPVRLCYLDSFERYETYFNISIDNYGYLYTKLGSRPTEINIPNRPDYSVTSKSIDNYQALAGLEYSSRNINWSYAEGEINNDYHFTQWSVYSLPGEYPVFEIPEEIRELIPEEAINKLEYTGTSLHMTPNYYEDVILKPFLSNISEPIDNESEIISLHKDF